jgi:formylglycine-generating enzyme required for sulfatase activity
VTPLGNKAPFCIDAHEVSFGELSAGIAAYHTDKNALYPLVEPECDWAWATLEPFSSRITQEGLNFANGWRDYPAVGLDWCEARAFCALLGKDLCGDLEGGANEADNSRSRWYMACSKNTAFIHSFQESPGPIACHAEDASTCPSIDAMLPVTATSCPGGFDGLFNMSGNAWEWTRHCYRGRGTAESDDCQVRGGNCASADISCGASATFSRSNLSEDITFRCCWSPAP